MKFAIALSALSSIATIFAEPVYFVATSEDKSVSSPISSIHEVAGINYFLTTSGGSGEVFNLDDGVASKPFGQYTAHVGVTGYLASGPAVTPTKFHFSGDTIDNYNFFACKDTQDPYNYSKDNYIIAAIVKSNKTAPFEKCIAVSIMKHAANDAPSMSSATPPTMHKQSHVPTDMTVTDYTTYCPESTTVTVTKCSEHKCAPHEFTVTEATTLTVTGECVVPWTMMSSKTSTIPSASKVEAGAAKAASAAGLGLVGLAALLF